MKNAINALWTWFKERVKSIFSAEDGKIDVKVGVHNQNTNNTVNHVYRRFSLINIEINVNNTDRSLNVSSEVEIEK